jgi:hypothetical protein
MKTLNPDWTRTQVGIQHEVLDPDPPQMNTDPKRWNKGHE